MPTVPKCNYQVQIIKGTFLRMFAEARAFHSANAAPGLTIAAVEGGQSRPRVKRRRAAVPERLCSDDETKPMKRDTQGFFEQIEQPHHRAADGEWQS